MTRARFVAAIVLLTSSAIAAETNSDSQALANAASGFYGVYVTLHPSDGIPDNATRAKFAPFVSSALDRLFVEGHDAEEHYAKATRNQSPPLLEGDIFTPNFEGATTFKIGSCRTIPGGGQCAVTLAYADRKDKPLVWTDTVYLVDTPGGWRVDDIAYGGNWDFGNKGRLTATLKDAIANGDEFSK